MSNRTKSKYEKAKITAKKFYWDWRRTGSYSPALDSQIKITRLGWDHLINPKKKRTKVQKIKRFQALPLAKKLIEKSTTFQEHRHEGGFDYYTFIAEMDGKKIKVVISGKPHKTKQFLSVIVLR